MVRHEAKSGLSVVDEALRQVVRQESLSEILLAVLANTGKPHDIEGAVDGLSPDQPTLD
ncbi:hypothetical protein [Novipirellula sp.]|uniref:hypothetical protein n=1 Tax=Novipirellula sp. TaxID=2795430 RepID=UPI003566EB7E